MGMGWGHPILRGQGGQGRQIEFRLAFTSSMPYCLLSLRCQSIIKKK